MQLASKQLDFYKEVLSSLEKGRFRMPRKIANHYLETNPHIKAVVPISFKMALIKLNDIIDELEKAIEFGLVTDETRIICFEDFKQVLISMEVTESVGIGVYPQKDKDIPLVEKSNCFELVLERIEQEQDPEMKRELIVALLHDMGGPVPRMSYPYDVDADTILALASSYVRVGKLHEAVMLLLKLV